VRRAGWLVAALVALGAPTDAQAGSYTVRQCDAAGPALHPRAPDAVAISNGDSYSPRDRCEEEQQTLQVDNVEPAAAGRYGGWRYEAPPGTEFVQLGVQARMERADDHVPELLVGFTSGPSEAIARGDSDLWEQFDWRAPAGAGARSLTARLRCDPSGQSICGEAASAKMRPRSFRLTVNDVASPVLALDGSLLGGGWHSGTESLAVGASDIGGGVRRVEVVVNGTEAGQRQFDCATITGHDLSARLAPCPATEAAGFEFDTTTAPFNEGANHVEICVEDYGTEGVNQTCAERTVRVDNEGPGPPLNLHVVGGDGWRATNSFDIAWENPEQPEGASKIVGAWYRLQSSSGTVSEPTFTAEANIELLPDLSVPDQGRFDLQVWLEDEAGNAIEQDGKTIALRFDDQVPGAPVTDAPLGWLGRRELEATYRQTWSTGEPLPVSGLSGFAVVADSFPNTNPCESAADPDPARCTAAEITHPWGSAMELGLAQIQEGSSWVHIAAASGSGVRSGTVSHVEIRADRTDPKTELLGVPAGWANEAPVLVARSKDDLSGMQAQIGDDGQPRTALRVNHGPTISDPDNEVVMVLNEEGDHLVRYWARDLAGNENDGDAGENGLPANNQPGVARVKLDMTPPTVGFANAQDPAEPELVRAQVSDGLSGVARGQISYRPEGTIAWTGLQTELRSGYLEARLSSDSLPDGDYELRAEAEDRAGNTVVTTRRQDGSDMVLTLPLKTGTELRADLGGGRERKTISYGRESVIEGRLVSAVGEPLGGQSIEISETFDLGSIESERTRESITDADGRFALVLPPGPSRSVSADFSGSKQLEDAESPQLDLGVRSGASLGATDRRPPVGKRFRFRGRVRRAGAEMPPGGKLVELQVRRPEGWDTVRQAFRTRPNGSWTFPFKFGPYYVEPTSFRFRLKVPRETGWPYKASSTDRRRVTVRP
jgi:hypothetical protein